MKVSFKKISVAIAFFQIASASADACPKPWICEAISLDVPCTDVAFSSLGGTPMLMPTIERKKVQIRAGILPASGAVFKGNVIYYEGLGNSMVNHMPLFSVITSAGYNLIAFDYMGQGGSTGSMNDTRIEFIPWIGDIVWRKFAKKLDDFPKKTVLGWSTGGLAAFWEALNSNVARVILIAPGIVPNTIVGEGLSAWPYRQNYS